MFALDESSIPPFYICLMENQAGNRVAFIGAGALVLYLCIYCVNMVSVILANQILCTFMLHIHTIDTKRKLYHTSLIYLV